LVNQTLYVHECAAAICGGSGLRLLGLVAEQSFREELNQLDDFLHLQVVVPDQLLKLDQALFVVFLVGCSIKVFLLAVLGVQRFSRLLLLPLRG